MMSSCQTLASSLQPAHKILVNFTSSMFALLLRYCVWYELYVEGHKKQTQQRWFSKTSIVDYYSFSEQQLKDSHEKLSLDFHRMRIFSPQDENDWLREELEDTERRLEEALSR